MTRPNILFITADQHRADCLGIEGRKIKTPHLDQLAAEGTRFANAITPCVICQPARASILTGQRNDIVRSIGEEVNASVSSLGIQIIDVRLRRADYPTATSQNIFNRMKSEREREAKEFRATGEEEAQKIRADAEKTRTVILSEAQREAQETRGAGDAEAIQIYADSFGQDAEFFAFYRSMEAYRKSMGQNDTSMVLSPESSFFRFFKDKSGTGQK